ncbi:MAG: carboxypeptidase regulatory-like domain-containing protein [Acidobacteria bacterium]|nr:carboxypeptidase regulatory-like domain-containing protein [Acidobacteriota bacterium]
MRKPSRSTPWNLLALLAMTAALPLACGGGGTETSAPPPAAETPSAPPAASAPAATGAPAPTGTSSISGSVAYQGAVPSFKPLNMDADPACAAKHGEPVYPEALVLGDGQTLGNIFVQVKNPPAGSYPTPSEAVHIDQNGCRYIPHVVGVMVGQPLQFKNSDGILHNVHGLPKENREFNIGMPPTVTEKDQTFNKPEPFFPVKCDVHPWMRSFVAVMTHPFFAVTGPDGAFSIEGLPAGTYDLEAWHEKLGTQTTSLTVADGESATADFSFSAPEG